jgi:hypothetical protein
MIRHASSFLVESIGPQRVKAVLQIGLQSRHRDARIFSPLFRYCVTVFQMTKDAKKSISSPSGTRIARQIGSKNATQSYPMIDGCFSFVVKNMERDSER